MDDLCHDRMLGVLLGTAIGDAIGLPFEGLSPRRVARRLDRRPLAHSLVCGRGMLSDDTEHTAMVARSLARAGHDPDAFARAFARELRRWLLTLPPGLGFATLRGALRSWLGFGPARSGVHSAGNGPAMRAALLGLWARDEAELAALVRASTRVTHTDPRAEAGALLVARWAREATAGPERLLELAAALDEDEVGELRGRVLAALELAAAGQPLEVYAQRHAPRGVTGFIVETMPAVGFCWLRFRAEPREAIAAAVRLGGDTDTVAAIVGALLGAEHGAAGLPPDWIAGVRDWPLGVDELHALARGLRGGPAVPRPSWLASTARNFALLTIVLAHLLARALRY